MFKLVFYVPASHADIVKNAIFEQGAGKLGQYSHCSWQVLGEGQFMPLDGSNAYIGTKNKLEKVPEYRIETLCDEKNLTNVISALKKSHPYETPAYEVFKLIDL